MMKRRTIVMGDIHGDFAGLDATLRRARLTDATGRWVGRSARLVQLGDCVDRGPASEEVLDHLRGLQDQARDAGGEVVRLLGNHEMELARGCTDYSSGIACPEALGERLRAEIIEGRIVAAATVGPWLCVHGGMRSAMRRTLITEARRGGLAPGLPGAVARANQILRDAAMSGRFTHALFGDSGIFWTYRHVLCPSLRALDVPQIVGHSVRVSPFEPGHRALFADQGLSEAMLGHRAYLEFETGTDAELQWHHDEGDGWKTVRRPMEPGTNARAA